MKRVVAIWLPNWPVQRVVLARPELQGRAIVLHRPSRGGQCVAAYSLEVQRTGVEAGMPMAEAAALLSRSLARGEQGKAELAPYDPLADRAMLKSLAQWCHRFSPTVGLDDAEAPDALLLDVTNLGPLYGGEDALIAQAAHALRRRGLDARIAAADTIGAAWAHAHFGSGDLPLAALRLPDALLETLTELGVRSVGEAFDLPRDQLRSRFGPLLLLRMDQLRGVAEEVIVAVEPAAECAVEQAFEVPVAQSEVIRCAIEQLLQRLSLLLAARNAGALGLACRFDCEGAPSVTTEFGLFQPTADSRHLLEIADLRLERLRLEAPVVAIEVRVVRQARLVQRQGMLFDENRRLGDSRPLAALVDRLAGRLGREAVVRCRLRNDAQPELAYREEPWVSGGKSVVKESAGPLKAARAKRTELGALDRPLCLLRRPAPLETVSVVPDGPPIWFRRGGQRYEVARHWGPERIETGWWRRTAARRDYYRVETTEGRRFWLFRQRRDGRWFLHGMFE